MSILGGTEKRAVYDIHIGIVAGIRQGVAAIFRPQVVGQSVHGAMEGKTQSKEVEFYSLDAIIAVGYRVSYGRFDALVKTKYDI